jgi:hypothetical protein
LQTSSTHDTIPIPISLPLPIDHLPNRAFNAYNSWGKARYFGSENLAFDRIALQSDRYSSGFEISQKCVDGAADQV